VKLGTLSLSLAIVLTTVGCGRKAAFVAPLEIVNNVEGSFTFKDETVKLNHAYARRVENEADKTKRDVLIVFTDRPAPWKVIDQDGSDQKLHEKVDKGELRALSVRLTDDKKATFTIYHGGAGGFGVFPPRGEEKDTPAKAEFKPVSFLPNLIEGQVSAKNETVTGNQDIVASGTPDPYGEKPEPPSYHFDLNFKVGLRPDEWTGVYYKYPATNLEPGKASGQVVVDGQVVKLNHVYARQSGYDLFGKNRVAVLLTEKPIATETLKDASENELLRAALQAGNTYIIYDNWTTSQPPVHPPLWSLEKVRAALQASEQVSLLDASDSLLTAEVDLSQFDSKALEGKIYTESPFKWFEHTYEIDVSFNAPVVITGDASSAPVVAGSGEPLPVGGGGPGSAYLNFVKSVSLARNLKELTQLLETSQSASAIAEMKLSLADVRPEQEEQLFGLLKKMISIANPSVEGGFATGDKATLWVTGSDNGHQITARVNMHLENGQWKVGRGSTHEE